MRKKLKRFQENAASSLVVEPGKDIFEKIKGKWRSDQFCNEHPIVLELACGGGEYTTGLSRELPDKNFIGVDIKGSRIWKGMSTATEEGLLNAAFLRTHIAQIGNFFEQDEVDEIWIIHPDPRPKKSDAHRRLTSPRYLNLYKTFLKKGSWVHLKTDNLGLFDYSIEILQERSDVTDLIYTHDVYQSHLLEDHYGIQTRYEQEALKNNLTIKYLKFRLH